MDKTQASWPNNESEKFISGLCVFFLRFLLMEYFEVNLWFGVVLFYCDSLNPISCHSISNGQTGVSLITPRQ